MHKETLRAVQANPSPPHLMRGWVGRTPSGDRELMAC